MNAEKSNPRTRPTGVFQFTKSFGKLAIGCVKLAMQPRVLSQISFPLQLHRPRQN